MGESEIRNDRGRPSAEVERTLYPIDDPDGSGSDSNFGLALPRPNQKGVEGRNLDGLGSFIGLGLSKPKSLNLEGRMRMRLGPTKSLDSKGYEGSILLAEGLREEGDLKESPWSFVDPKRIYKGTPLASSKENSSCGRTSWSRVEAKKKKE